MHYNALRDLATVEYPSIDVIFGEGVELGIALTLASVDDPLNRTPIMAWSPSHGFDRRSQAVPAGNFYVAAKPRKAEAA